MLKYLMLFCLSRFLRPVLLLCGITFAFCFLYSCGSDNTVNNNPVTPPPTLQDSIVKLISPANFQHFNTGDSICHIWNRGYYTAYRYYTDLDSSFSGNNYILVTDTSAGCGEWIDTSQAVNYWKVVPYLRDTIRFQYSSEVRSYSTN